ncbi:hypothetical protein E7T09_05550 [Deinococcus sp. KSM4-11]|uniref:hypothetical protein n=1 Tax=Deinococcus sp. KSM4-11 TaxID=2568654 RepID=UPI0010A46846|nr:hypothetical protein [Deinococcus sp. KSM4-11]THF88653.1 hypothetical protein E7T09_05550 [Deinococcus sp. KSM4-11]
MVTFYPSQYTAREDSVARGLRESALLDAGVQLPTGDVVPGRTPALASACERPMVGERVAFRWFPLHAARPWLSPIHEFRIFPTPIQENHA